jgi:bifunctional non-homologous end joining protein LigD
MVPAARGLSTMAATAVQRIRVGGRTVEITNPEKVLFPQDGITKLELVDYYRAIARRMMPHLRDRPVNLQRFPAGISRPGFFQQGMPDHYPDWIDSVLVKKRGGSVRHVVVQSAATLAHLANLGCITLHAWLSRRDQLERPDMMIFDLDPPTGSDKRLKGVVSAVGQLLRERRLVPFLKTTGSRGYHVVVPLSGRQSYDEVRSYAREVAEEMIRRHPRELTTEGLKRERGGRIYLDTLRNAYAHTAVPPFAVRARDGAPVATPIGWDELDDPGMTSDRFTIRTVLERVESVPDPWADFRKSASTLSS